MSFQLATSLSLAWRNLGREQRDALKQLKDKNKAGASELTWSNFKRFFCMLNKIYVYFSDLSGNWNLKW